MKFLIVGLGNPGSEYEETRHNIGFKILDALAGASNVLFTPDRYASRTEMRHKGRTFVMIKPSTFMNLSGNAVRYWMQKEGVSIENVLVLTDDLALPFGKIRIRAKGSDGGHNGLSHIQQILNSTEYARMRFGIGSEFSKGHQVNYVLGEWSEEERKTLAERIKMASDAIISFGMMGLSKTMSEYNAK
ncbi:MAG: aminoacyl-tRNA hydrolase [Flavobacteriales bacterium]|nr:aminoacyl-tRNA hydrolase [Flavobacteriales bacterium]